MQANELLQRIESKRAPVIIDPRSEIEFRRGHIPGAINAPVRKILLNLARLPKDKDLEMVIACMHGQRAVISKWLLALYGYRNTAVLEGYLEGWEKAGLPWEKADS
jgi:rhodanese-related sulfurtransferase